MGRLTLNVLLSFAQCFQEERHVDGGSLQAELDGAGIRSKRRMWRVQEEQGIELMLMLNDMTRADVEVVDFPYPDGWYDKPEMLAPMENPSELWLKRDHKHDLAFRPLEMALLDGTVDAIYTQTGPFQHIQEQTGKIKAIENLANYPDWTLQGANVPATCTVSDVACKEHPGVVVALLKGLIKVGRWSNEHKHAAAAILDKQTYYLDVEDTYRNILNVDMVPKLSPYNLEALRINKDFMLNHGYIENDFDVYEWAAPEFVEKAAAELLEEEWKKRSMDKLPEATSLNDAMTARLG
jgi:ABC-type nitrate/sulfonate/bicarbonate transport system substrate-binding protein